MSDLVKDLLWLGIEDLTGLWSAAWSAEAIEGIASIEAARDRAPSVLGSLLAEGLVDLYLVHGLPQNAAAAVPHDRGPALLRDDECWTVPEEGETSVWFATTEKGFDRYCE